MAGHARSALPIDMDSLDGGKADMHGAVDGSASLGEDARNAERLVVVLQERDGAEAMRDDDLSPVL